MTFGEAARFGSKSAPRVAQLSAMVAVAIILAAWFGITSVAASTLVETANGWVQGKTVGSVDQWLGIRYAASPAGVGRWAPPKSPGSYGTRQNPYAATQFGAPCPQNISQFGNSIPLPTPPNTVPAPGSADKEDCLFLNVYVPADRLDDGHEPLPVLFWIHGGSNEYGEGSSYDPTPLVTQGHIIVVTINYRLGALGWLAHPLLDDGSPNSSGNYGLMDQQFAMRWVNRNIAAFGGDPHKVTIGGDFRRRDRQLFAPRLANGGETVSRGDHRKRVHRLPVPAGGAGSSQRRAPLSMLWDAQPSPAYKLRRFPRFSPLNCRSAGSLWWDRTSRHCRKRRSRPSATTASTRSR